MGWDFHGVEFPLPFPLLLTRTLCSLALRSLASPLWIGSRVEWDWVSCVWRGLENLNIFCKGKGVEAGLGVGPGEGKLEWASAKDSESFRRVKRNLLDMI